MGEFIYSDGLKVDLVKKKQKNIYIRVYPPDGRVRVSAPAFVSDEEIESLIRKKSEWIKKARQIILAKRSFLGVGDEVSLWGKLYSLDFDENLKNSCFCESTGKLILACREDIDFDHKKNILDEFYRDEVKKALDLAIKKAEEMTGLRANEYRLRKMKSRWGSCNVRAKRIWINIYLAKYDPICLQAVLIHELAHLVEVRHNKRFYDLVNDCYPAYKKAQALLKNIY